MKFILKEISKSYKKFKKIYLVGDTRVLSLDGENEVEKIYYIKDNINELTPKLLSWQLVE